MASNLINKALNYLGWKRAKAKIYEKGEQASTKAKKQDAIEHEEDEQTSTNVDRHNKDEINLKEIEKCDIGREASTKVEEQDATEQVLVETEKHSEDERTSTIAELHNSNELALKEVGKCDIGAQALAKSTTQYGYEKLDPGSIRVINILPPSVHDDQIKCKMTSLAADSFSPTGFEHYDALSYEWADAQNIKEIILDGKIFHIRENLWQALRCLRSNNISTLWIDAISIDQNNISERNQQVSQMSKIYAKARQVIVWLGPESCSSSDAFTCIRKYARGPISWTAAIADNSWEALVELCDRSYWHRLWIIQEVVVARELEIYCGRSRLYWKDLVSVCDNLSSIPELDGDPPIFKNVRKNIAFQLVRIRKAWRRSETTLRELLETCEKSLCVDPRDKIYGLLGLANNTRGSLSVDYSKSLFEIYKDVVHFQWDIDNCSIVSFSQFLQWYLWHETDSNQSSFTAALRLRTSQNVVGHIISAAGIRRGTIFSRGPIFGGTAETRNAWTSTVASRFPYQGSDLKKQAAQLATSYHENEISERNRIVYLNGFALNGLSKILRQPELEKNFNVHSSVKKIELHGNPLEPYPRLFALNGGQIGLGPNEIQIGDSVCQFLNCDVAAILRPNGNNYKLIGRVLLAADDDIVSTYSSKYCRQQYDIPRHSFISEYRDHITVFLDQISLQLLTR